MRLMEQAAWRIWAPILWLTWLVLTMPVSQAVAGCLEDLRPVKIGEHVARLRSFLCTADEGSPSAPLARVEFHRLSDPAASMLFSGTPTKLTNEALGEVAIVKNRVYTAIQQLVEQFSLEMSGYDMSMSIEAPRSSSGEVQIDHSTSPTILVLSKEELLQTGLSYRPHYQQLKTQWNVLYGASALHGDPSDADDRITYWRYLQGNETISELPSLYKYLIQKGCTKDFVLLAHDPQLCTECVPCVVYHAKRPIVDIAVIENSSNRAIQLDGIYGREITGPICRIASTSLQSEGGVQRIWGDGLMLTPGARVLLPLKLTFSAPDIASKIIANSDKVRSAYKRLRMSRDNVLPPKIPQAVDHIFGPEWRLTAIDIDGVRVSLAKKSTNFLNSTVGSGEGSCPYLMAWNPATERWTEYGKILHVAKSKDTEQAHTTRISGFRSKFRLAEREPEIAYLDHAELTAELKDGRSLILTAGESRLASRDGRYVVLRMGEQVDFQFKLPDGVTESNVNESRLTVFGYYEPNTSLVRN